VVWIVWLAGWPTGFHVIRSIEEWESRTSRLTIVLLCSAWALERGHTESFLR